MSRIASEVHLYTKVLHFLTDANKQTIINWKYNLLRICVWLCGVSACKC